MSKSYKDKNREFQSDKRDTRKAKKAFAVRNERKGLKHWHTVLTNSESRA